MWPDKESSSDYLNFGEVSQLAVDILTSPPMLPVSLGVFGNWGAGKSSLLKLIENGLQSDGADRLVINFDAWLYQGYDDARAALLEVIARNLHKAVKDNESLLQKTKRLLARVDGFRMLGFIAEGVALVHGVPTGGILYRGVSAISNLTDGIQGEEYQDLTRSASEVIGEVKKLIKPPPDETPPQQIEAFRKEYSEILNELGKPLIVIIDNLDRCLPSNAIHTLEAIRLFLFLPNTAFVIAADEEMIRIAVAEYFKGSSGRHHIDYLDKLIQVPINVPKAGLLEIRSYLFMLFAIEHGVESDQLETLRKGLEVSLQRSWNEDPISKDAALKLTGKSEDGKLATAYELADRIAPILATSPIIHGNPRIVKRLLNVVRMRSKIARRREMPLSEEVITKLVIFERCAGVEATTELYKLVDAESGKPKILTQLESAGTEELPSDAPNSWGNNPTTKKFILDWIKLEPSLKDKDLRPAIYLSRETMPIGAYVIGLSPKSREALNTLANVSAISSPEGKKTAESIPLEDRVPVMEGIVDHLREVADWSKQPKGFAGAVLLAEISPDAAKIFKRFADGLGNKKPWMNAMIKDKEWNR
ncbi:MAG: P-loop NTPase fold protein [Pseudomonadota bacterium]